VRLAAGKLDVKPHVVGGGARTARLAGRIGRFEPLTQRPQLAAVSWACEELRDSGWRLEVDSVTAPFESISVPLQAAALPPPEPSRILSFPGTLSTESWVRPDLR
jgi:hypothetical protein